MNRRRPKKNMEREQVHAEDAPAVSARHEPALLDRGDGVETLVHDEVGHERQPAPEDDPGNDQEYESDADNRDDEQVRQNDVQVALLEPLKMSATFGRSSRMNRKYIQSPPT